MSIALLTGPQGESALALAAEQPDPGSVQAATRLRARFSPELATAALHQEALRRRAAAKFGDRARHLLFTADGIEQATRAEVSRWRFARLRSWGITHLLDLGCGIGADALAALDAGLQVVAVELDPDTAACARHNLALADAGARLVEGDATALLEGLLAEMPADTTAILVDPARRTARGRSWRLEDLSPPWSFVTDLVVAGRPTVVKLGPGIDRGLLPPVPTSHVSHAGAAVETTLWSGFGGLLPVEAVVIDRGGVVNTLGGDHPRDAPLGPLAAFVHEPDPALSRAQLVTALADDLVQLDVGAGYFSSDAALDGPFMTSFRVIEVLEARTKTLKQWVRSHDVGTLEIKKRGSGGLLDTDPAELRRTLAPRGTRTATLVLARVQGHVRALYVERAAVA